MISQLIIILGFLSAFLLRLGFCISTSEGASDEWVSFWRIRHLHGKRWISYFFEDSKLNGSCAYPLFPFWIISRFPEKYWGIFGRILNSLWDVLTGIIVFIISKTLLEHNIISVDKIAGLEPELAITLLFLFSPVLFPVMSRLRTIKGRPFGLFLSTIYFAVIGVSIISGNLYFTFFALPIGLLIILSSQFTMQVIILFSVSLSIMLQNSIPILITFAVFIIAYLIPKVGTREVIRWWCHHKIWYWRNYKCGTTANGRNILKEPFLIPYTFFTKPKLAITGCFKRFTIPISLSLAPVLTVLLAICFYRPNFLQSIMGNPTLNYMASLTVSSLIVFFITSIPPFTCVGQSERYLEYSSPAFVILFIVSVSFLDDPYVDKLFWILMCLHLIFIALNMIYLNMSKLTKSGVNISESFENAVKWCSENIPNAYIATVPIKLSFAVSECMHAKYPAKCKFYYRGLHRPGETGLEYQEKDRGGYLLSDNKFKESFNSFKIIPKELSSKYGITHIFINNNPKYIEGLRYTWGKEGSDLLDNPIYENEEYMVVKINI